MTAYAIIRDGQAVELQPGRGFTDANGVQHPAEALTDAWPSQRRTAFGIYGITEPDEVAADQRITSTTLHVVNDRPVRQHTLQAIPLSELKAAALQAIRDRRWVAENAGVTLGGQAIRTDERTQSKVTGGLELFRQSGALVSLDWEAQPGVFATLDQPTLAAIGVAIGTHVQACFTRSRELSEAVTAAGSTAALQAIDIEAGWPA